MTEVPEHLLRRSRERREALGLSTGDGGEGGGSEAPAPAAASDAGGEQAPAPAAAAAPAAPPPPPEPAKPPPPPPPYVQAAYQRSRIPAWAMPVVALLPLWAFVYAGSLDTNEAEATGPLALGAEVYSANCAQCHGGSGGGGVGPALADGKVLETFPERDGHVELVRQGTQVIRGEGYGDPGREGGQRVAETGGMPPWEGVLTDEEIEAVVLHERVVFGGEEPPPEGEAPAAGAEGTPSQGDPGDTGGDATTDQPTGESNEENEGGATGGGG